MKAKKKTSAKKRVVKSAAKVRVTRASKTNAKKAAKVKIAVSVKKSRKKTKPTVKAEKIEFPPILFEGDKPASIPAPQGAGTKFALGPEPVKNHFQPEQKEESFELPESYGTGEMFATARDPYWIYAAWDLPTAKIKQYNKLSKRGSMTLRVYLNEATGEAQSEIQLYPNSRDWFVRVNTPGATYVLALGYYDKQGQFNKVIVSEPVKTPEAISSIQQTIFAAPQEPLKTALAEQEKPETRTRGVYAKEAGEKGVASYKMPEKPEFAPEITLEDQLQLFAFIYGASQRGSIELVKMKKAEAPKGVEAAGQFPAPTGQPPTQPERSEIGVSSPKGGVFEQKRKFWFNIQAELIIYGATEPDARVLFGGEEIPLRPDGSFTLRFALPDGFYKVFSEAISRNGSERRVVNLEFSRKTTAIEGEIGECQPNQKLTSPGEKPKGY